MTGNDIYNMFRSEDKGAQHAPLFDNTITPSAADSFVTPVDKLAALALTPMNMTPQLDVSKFNPFKKKERDWSNAIEIVPDEIPKYMTLDAEAEAAVLENAIPDVPWYRFDKKAAYVADQVGKEVSSRIESIGDYALRGVVLAGAIAIVLLGIYLFIKDKSLGKVISKAKGG